MVRVPFGTGKVVPKSNAKAKNAKGVTTASKTKQATTPKKSLPTAASQKIFPKTRKIFKKVAKPGKSKLVKSAKALRAATAKPPMSKTPQPVKPKTAKAQLPGKAKTAKSKSTLGYTPQEHQRYKSQIKNLQGWSIQKLKDTLSANLQTKTGNKDELIQKVADGIVLGRIPKCTSCFGGRPRFDFQKGTYLCKGFRDDVDYINCHKVFSLADVKRTEWVA